MTNKESNHGLITDYEIMIVGGGPAGISTWLHLHKYAPELAAKTVLIEKEKYPRDKLCGGGLQNWMSTKIFNNLEIKLEIPYVSINNFEIRHGDKMYIHKEQNFFNIVNRSEFDHYLAKKAINRGLLINENESFLGITRKSQGLIVSTSKTKYHVQIVIGADGALSKVRKSMNLQVRPRLIPAIEIFAPVDPHFDPEFNTKTAILDFTPVNEGLQGYVWHFPCLKDGQPMMNHGIVDSRLHKNIKKANLKKIFNRELQSRNIHCSIKVWQSHPIPYFLNEGKYSQPNILLVGDAAGIEPLLGSGIQLALAYGDVAATAIKDAFENNNFLFDDYTQRIQNHYLGKYINKLTNIAKDVYLDNTKLLESIVEIIKYKK